MTQITNIHTNVYQGVTKFGNNKDVTYLDNILYCQLSGCTGSERKCSTTHTHLDRSDSDD